LTIGQETRQNLRKLSKKFQLANRAIVTIISSMPINVWAMGPNVAPIALLGPINYSYFSGREQFDKIVATPKEKTGH
jgi:hypothetical protein